MWKEIKTGNKKEVLSSWRSSFRFFLFNKYGDSLSCDHILRGRKGNRECREERVLIHLTASATGAISGHFLFQMQRNDQGLILLSAHNLWESIWSSYIDCSWQRSLFRETISAAAWHYLPRHMSEITPPLLPFWRTLYRLLFSIKENFTKQKEHLRVVFFSN